MKRMVWELRQAAVDDAESILVLQRLAYQSEAAIYDDFTIPPLTETLEEIAARFRDRRFLKAVAGDRIVGSVRAVQEGATCHLERLIVDPDWRRRGIGAALLRQIETLFPAARRFELFTGHKSEGNIRLYRRHGYRTCRQERINEKVSLVFMEKTLRVRAFGPADKATFRRLNEAWITKYFAVEEKDRKLLDDPEGQILARGGTIFILERDGEPVGCCSLLARDDAALEVAKMAIAEAHQGNGFGRVLLDACIEKARLLGKKKLFIETSSKLGPALALYRSAGFVELPPDAAASPRYARGDVLLELPLGDRRP